MKKILILLLFGFIWCCDANTNCTTPLNRDGYCVKSDDCPPIKSILDNVHRRRHDVLFIKDSYCGKTKIGKKYLINVCCDVEVASVGCVLPKFPKRGIYVFNGGEKYNIGDRVEKGTVLTYKCNDSFHDIEPFPDSKVYCQENNKWSNVVTCPAYRKMEYGNSTLIAVGGQNEKEIETFEVFDLVSRNWIEIKEKITNIYRYATVLLKNELILIGGAVNFIPFDSVKSYNLETGKKTSLQSMTYARYNLAAVELNGHIYAIGGNENESTHLKNVEKYDPVSKEWSEVSSMADSHQFPDAVVVNGEIFVIGAYRENFVMEAYNSSTNKWRICKAMNIRRSYPSLASVDGYLYAVGGFENDQFVNNVEKYDPRTDQWKTIRSLEYGRCTFSAGNFMGQLVIAGGINSTHHLKLVEKYEPSIDRWLTAESMKENKYGVGSTTIDDSEKWKNIPPLNIHRVFFGLIEIPWNLAQRILSRKH